MNYLVALVPDLRRTAQPNFCHSLSLLLQSSALIFGGPTPISSKVPLWRVDATGQFWLCHAAVVGRGCSQAEQKLIEMILSRTSQKSHAEENSHRALQKCLNELNEEDALVLACETIRQTLALTRARIHWTGLVLNRTAETFRIYHYSHSELNTLLAGRPVLNRDIAKL